MYTIGIDLGGTKIATALADDNGHIVKRVEVPTHAAEGPDAVIERMADTARKVMAGVQTRGIVGVGIGAPGPLNPRTGMVLGPPNLPGWNVIPLQQRMEALLELPVVIDNDANVAAIAECRLGAGHGAENMLYVTVSTGIGGGVIMDGSIRHGASGLAAEIGHIIVDVNGPLCNCGNRGCLEAVASGTAIRRLAQERLGQAWGAREVAAAAASGDGLAASLLDDAFRWLGIGLINAVQLFDPAVIVIGGGVAQIGQPMFDTLQQVLDGNLFRTGSPAVRVVPAALGTQSGVIGAALLPWMFRHCSDGKSRLRNERGGSPL